MTSVSSAAASPAAHRQDTGEYTPCERGPAGTAGRPPRPEAAPRRLLRTPAGHHRARASAATFDCNVLLVKWGQPATLRTDAIWRESLLPTHDPIMHLREHFFVGPGSPHKIPPAGRGCSRSGGPTCGNPGALCTSSCPPGEFRAKAWSATASANRSMTRCISDQAGAVSHSQCEAIAPLNAVPDDNRNAICRCGQVKKQQAEGGGGTINATPRACM